MILYSVCDTVMNLCPFCNRRTINLLDDDDDDDDSWIRHHRLIVSVTLNNITFL